MRLSFLLLLLSIAPLAGAQPPAAAPADDPRTAIERANDAFEDTFARADATAMAGLYTDDGQVLPSGSGTVAGHDALAEFWQGIFDMGLAAIELETIEVEGHGDMAHEVGRYTLSDAGGEVADRGKYIVIWQREDGQWKVHRDIFNTSLAPAATATGSSMLSPDDLQWTEIVPGVSFAPAYGDWQAERHGKFVRFEPGASAPMHTHSHPYDGVMLRGRMTNPYAAETEPTGMEPGTHWHVPGKVAHGNSCVSDESCLFYTHGDAAWDIAIVEE